MFVDVSGRIGASEVFTRLAREEFFGRGRFKPADSGTDYELRGKVLEVNDPAGSVRPTGTGYRSLSLDLHARLELALTDASGLVIRETVIEDTAPLPGGPYPERGFNDRRQALENLARRMLRRGYDELTESF